MIFSTIQGGLGNQMFQVACGVSHAMDISSQYYIDYNCEFTPNQGCPASTYRHSIFKNIPVKTIPNGLTQFNENGIGFNTIPKTDNLFLNGYFQSWKYFDHNFEILIELFHLPPEYVNEALRILEHFGVNNLNFNCIHVRCGDYTKFQNVFHLLDREYYQKGTQFLEKYNLPTIVVTDDMEYARSVITTQKCIYISNQSELVDFALLYLCKNIVIANSTFSWWASYLSREFKENVVFPNKWFRQPGMLTNDLIPEAWINVEKMS